MNRSVGRQALFYMDVVSVLVNVKIILTRRLIFMELPLEVL